MDLLVLIAGIVLVVGALIAGLVVSVRLGLWVSERLTESPEDREARLEEKRLAREDRNDR